MHDFFLINNPFLNPFGNATAHGMVNTHSYAINPGVGKSCHSTNGGVTMLFSHAIVRSGHTARPPAATPLACLPRVLVA